MGAPKAKDKDEKEVVVPNSPMTVDFFLMSGTPTVTPGSSLRGTPTYTGTPKQSPHGTPFGTPFVGTRILAKEPKEERQVPPEIMKLVRDIMKQAEDQKGISFEQFARWLTT